MAELRRQVVRTAELIATIEAPKLFASQEARDHWVQAEKNRTFHRDRGCQCTVCKEGEARRERNRHFTAKNIAEDLARIAHEDVQDLHHMPWESLGKLTREAKTNRWGNMSRLVLQMMEEWIMK